MIKWRWPPECIQVGNGGLKLERSVKVLTIAHKLAWCSHPTILLIILPMNLWLHLNKEHQIVSKIHDSNWGSHKPWWRSALHKSQNWIQMIYPVQGKPFLWDVGCSDGFLLKENIKWLEICSDPFGEKTKKRVLKSQLQGSCLQVHHRMWPRISSIISLNTISFRHFGSSWIRFWAWNLGSCQSS